MVGYAPGPEDCPTGLQDGRRRPDKVAQCQTDNTGTSIMRLKAAQRQTDNTGISIMRAIGIVFFAFLFLASHAHLSSK
eukprot:8839755-Pyramimonas_sp.AAC.1